MKTERQVAEGKVKMAMDIELEHRGGSPVNAVQVLYDIAVFLQMQLDGTQTDPSKTAK